VKWDFALPQTGVHASPDAIADAALGVSELFLDMNRFGIPPVEQCRMLDALREPVRL
jgi:hypothetical protein